ncbi:hypothetical protein A3SI_19755 [Nitritalea halalkaliphila LW7]|uniref:DUF4407 domain-containing protein n=1 Tax=Nitritalea halalkaliphila LW7 TaxID=1189621 RepID=I5BS72_9BACT|nr:DUF4407 domain-containing protein [Nitritalea halalkaliphila]EIM72424.1 hypothetical protein A3SI_19755 [Nitritalea halalkaliphila LW7]
MTALLKIFASLFSYDYQELRSHSAQSRQKVITLGLLLLLPTSVWFFSATYLVHVLLGVSLFAGLLTGFVASAFIFVVDRSMVVARISGFRSWIFGFFRLAFAVGASIIGAISIDLALFGGDIEEFRAHRAAEEQLLFQEEFKEQRGGELLPLREELAAARAEFVQLRAAHLAEMDGAGGSGVRGFGKVAEAKGREKELAAARVASLEARVRESEEALAGSASAYAAQRSSRASGTLMSRIRDLHDFVLSDYLVLSFYVIFFGVVLLLELFVLLYKMLSPTTSFEEHLDAEDRYRRGRLEAYARMQADTLEGIRLLGEDYERLSRRPSRRGIRGLS